MDLKEINRLVLTICVSAAAASGCTRMDARLHAEKIRAAESSPPAASDFEAPGFISEPDPPTPIPFEHTEAEQAPAEPTPSVAEEGKALLDELDSALSALEDSLGATSDWDVELP